MTLRIRVHEASSKDITKTATWKRLRKVAAKFMDSKEDNLAYWFNRRSSFDSIKDTKADSLWYIGAPYACPIMVFDAYSVSNSFDGTQDCISWQQHTRKYTPERGSIKNVSRDVAIDCITAALYESYEGKWDSVTEIDANVYRKIYIFDNSLISFILIYDGKTYEYRTNTNTLDKVISNNKDVSTFREATPEEIADPSIEWVMYGKDKYDRCMVNYNLGIWRDLDFGEFYGNGTVD